MNEHPSDYYDQVFDTLLHVLVDKLEIGYAIGIGFQAIADRGTELATPYSVSDNWLQCQIRIELKKENISIPNKLINRFLENIKKKTEFYYASGVKDGFKVYFVEKKNAKLRT